MYRGNALSQFSMVSLLSAGVLVGSGAAFAQTKPAAIPDAQIEANVLKALAGAPELADQSITSTTVYGTVTLNGTVRDEPLRDLAEHVVANTAGCNQSKSSV
jgi:osmotically-inducible protein OsmY